MDTVEMHALPHYILAIIQYIQNNLESWVHYAA